MILVDTASLVALSDPRDALQRERLRRLLVELPVRPLAVADEGPVWEDASRWMGRYAEHEPGWADAYLSVLSGRERRARVWTYDSEFRTTWRRLDAGRIPLAVR